MNLPKRLERRRRTYNDIKRRWNILLSNMQSMGSETKEEARSEQILTPHHLHKYNLNCGCHVCNAAKKDGKYNRAKNKLSPGS